MPDLRIRFLFFILVAFFFQGLGQSTDDGKISINLLQLNDVYEISPLNNGTEGGLSRVARVKKRLLAENPNTYAILSGDFLYPSALGTIKYNGVPMYGRQMVDALNAMGLDLATFGNHEFDIPESELINRINESRFDWISSNVLHISKADTTAFIKIDRFTEESIPKQKILQFKDTDGTIVRIGVLGICINSNPKKYLKYEDYAWSTRRSIEALKQHCDFIIAVTHLPIEDDRALAAKFPEISLILGGHEHVHSYDTIGNCRIAKADANAKTVYIHQLLYDKTTKQLSIQSVLTRIDQSIPDDPETQLKVDQWNNIGTQSLRNQGFDPNEVLANLDVPYDGRERSVRYKSTNLTRMIAKAMSSSAMNSDFTMYNSGSIRLDDELQGKITQYDIIRTLPYGGKILLVELNGSNIKQGLDYALQNTGNGSYPQLDRIRRDEKGVWYIADKPLDLKKTYTMSINDYLVDVSEEFKPYFGRKSLGVIHVIDPAAGDIPKSDLRQAVIAYLRQGGR